MFFFFLQLFGILLQKLLKKKNSTHLKQNNSAINQTQTTLDEMEWLVARNNFKHFLFNTFVFHFTLLKVIRSLLLFLLIYCANIIKNLLILHIFQKKKKNSTISPQF